MALQGTEADAAAIRQERADALTSDVAEYLGAQADYEHARKERDAAAERVANALADYLGGNGPALRRPLVVTIRTGKLAGKSFVVTPGGGTDFNVEPIEIVK